MNNLISVYLHCHLFCQDLSNEDEIVVHLPDFDPVDVQHFINSIYGWREHKDDIFITKLHKFFQFGTGLIENGVKLDSMNKDEAPKVSPIKCCLVKSNLIDAFTPEMGLLQFLLLIFDLLNRPLMMNLS